MKTVILRGPVYGGFLVLNFQSKNLKFICLEVLTGMKNQLYWLANCRSRRETTVPKVCALWALFKNQQVVCVGTRIGVYDAN